MSLILFKWVIYWLYLNIKNNQLEIKFAEIKLGIGQSIAELVKEKSLSSTKRRANRGYMNLGHQKDGYFIDNKK